METGGMSCIKCLLIFFNFIFALAGAGLVVSGVFVLLDVDNFSTFLTGGILTPPIILIIAGIILFLLSFLGYCGAVKESYPVLVLYAILLLLILVVELSVGIAAAYNKEYISEYLREDMKNILKNNNYAIDTEDRQIWGKLQSKLQCCGVDGPADWVMGGLYPESCCKNSGPLSHDRLCGPSKEFVYQDGCYVKLRDKVKEGSTIVMGVGIGIGLLQFFGVILAFLLASGVRKGGGGELE